MWVGGVKRNWILNIKTNKVKKYRLDGKDIQILRIGNSILNIQTHNQLLEGVLQFCTRHFMEGKNSFKVWWLKIEF